MFCASRFNRFLVVVVFCHINIITNIAVTTIFTGICGKAHCRTSRCSYNAFMVMRNSIYIIAYIAIITINASVGCKAMLCASGFCYNLVIIVVDFVGVIRYIAIVTIYASISCITHSCASSISYYRIIIVSVRKFKNCFTNFANLRFCASCICSGCMTVSRCSHNQLFATFI